MDVDDFFFTDGANDGDRTERLAGGDWLFFSNYPGVLNDLTPIGLLQCYLFRGPTTAKNRTQQRETDQNLSRIITQAADEKPHHRDKVLRSLQTFTRAMMGLSQNAQPQELPTSVTAEELASWDTWRERRKDAFSQRLKEATDKHPDANEQEIKHIRKSVIDQLKSRLVPVTFHASPFPASLAVSIHVKREMEAGLAKHGFHRFTFNWDAAFAHDVLWNSVAVDITVRNWLPWAKRTHVDVAESSIPGIKTRFFQWITNQGLSRMKVKLTPTKVAAQRKHANYVRSTKRKIATLRANTFQAVYPERKILAHLLRDPDAVSDFEEDDANTLPRRLSAHWRSPGMENIVRSLDHVAFKRAKSTQKKMSVRGLLDQKDARAPTAEERQAQPVPARFPRDAYDTNYLLEEGEFQADHLTTKPQDIENLGKEMVRKAFGAGSGSPAVNGSSGPTGPPPPATHTTTQQQTALAPGNTAGPSGSEVQMSE
ncbi:hypothetical protein PSTG_04336 [Puccinia striiformis f. sp. tritici PST-78]|uniref:Uncharacterized protein n=1 Tax=Puccinia striiformis f. sp. tritici PST-78 TaxID=1165861 RepID=A0A0L0VTV9_9BASI|nr:hypothetical protein PSTG_04336 [Puccinia striiformis f. sp. tritici PST-78]